MKQKNLMPKPKTFSKNHYSQIIKERIDSLKDILEELFSYTKLQDDDFELKLEKVNITQILFNSIFSFYDDFSQKGIEPKIDIDDGEILINGNESALKRVFYNIIKNAKEHINSKTEKYNVEIKLKRYEEKVVFQCSNSAEIKEDMEIEKVFERFYKYDKARTFNSTGLGLSIAKEFVQKMEGEIKAEFKDDMFSIIVEFKVL